MSVVVDTNVAMVASGHSDQADAECVNACIQRLHSLMLEGVLLIDELRLILQEYLVALGHAGQPGAGEVFVKWAWSNQSTPQFVRQVALTPRADNAWRRFEEFPDRDDLSRFDRNDQKFAAVAVASGENPPILNAVDSDWWEHREALADSGIHVEFLCPHLCGPRPKVSKPKR